MWRIPVTCDSLVLLSKKRLPANNLEDCSLKRVGFNEILTRSIMARCDSLLILGGMAMDSYANVDALHRVLVAT